MMLSLVATACGEGVSLKEGPAAGPTSYDLQMEMKGQAFVPATVKVQRGEQVRFVFHNQDSVPHEAFIGDAAAQAAHEQAMRAADGRPSGPRDPMSVIVAPGQYGALKFKFDAPGDLEIGCHDPGHYAAAMKTAVTVIDPAS
jgi:uncharacterized cupredoxin-like copper-binding protein